MASRSMLTPMNTSSYHARAGLWRHGGGVAGSESASVAGASLPAVTHLVVREILADLRHLRGGRASGMYDRLGI